MARRPDVTQFGALRLDPWLLRVQPSAVLLEGRDDLLAELACGLTARRHSRQVR